MMKFEEVDFTKEQLIELKEIIENNIKKSREKMKNCTPYTKSVMEFSINMEQSELDQIEERLKKL